MSMKALFGLLVFGFLLSGCICPQTGQGETNQTGGTTGQTGTTTGGASTGGTSSTGGADAASVATYTAAVASGLPMECTVTTQGQTTTVFIKGQSMLFTGTSSGKSYTVIMKNDYAYMELDSSMKSSFEQMGKSCDWLLLTSGNQTSSGGSSTSPIDTSAYTDPQVTWSCTLASFGDEKFATAGGICTMEDLYAGYGTQ